jgi:hypothetical protein
MTLGNMAVGVTDFTTLCYWTSIQRELLKLCPFSVNPPTGISRDPSAPENRYSPIFSLGPCDDELCHIFVLSYESKIDERHTNAVIEWREQHPATIFFIVAMDVLRSTFSFSTQKSKIEGALASIIGGCSVCVVRYFNDYGTCADADIKQLRGVLKSSSGFGYSHRIATLEATIQLMDQSSPDFAKTVSRLAYLYWSFGFYQAAKSFYRKLMETRGLPLWPGAPLFLDVLGPMEPTYASTYEIIGAAFSGILKCHPHDWTQQGDTLLAMFPLLLANAQTPEHVAFARAYIRDLSLRFCRQVEADPALARTFGLIACMEAVRLGRIEYDRSAPFLARLPPNLLGRVDVQELAGRVFEGLPRHQALARYVAFEVLAANGDGPGARAALERTAFDGAKHWLIESMALEYMFGTDMEKEQVAPVLVSSRTSDAIRSDAVAFLAQTDGSLEPQISLHARIFAEDFVRQHELFDVVLFAVAVEIPAFMVGMKVVVVMYLFNGEAGDENNLTAKQQEIVLEKNMILRAEIECLFIGVFDTSHVTFQLSENFQLIWTYGLSVPLTVRESQHPISFDLKMPCFLATGTTQSGVFVVDNVDTSISELTIFFNMAGLSEIRIGTDHFEAKEQVVVDKIEKTLECLLIFQIPAAEDDSVTVAISILRADGTEVRRSESFQLPATTRVPIRLVNQSELFQHFHLTNPFPVGFTFTVGDRAHEVRPYATYSFIREASSSPLRLAIVEEGWEDFPVEIVTPSFMTDAMTVQLTYQQDWIAGTPQMVTADPPAFPVDDRDSDWIIVPQDKEGVVHLAIPKCPGLLRFPAFQVNHLACLTSPESVRVEFCDYPPFVPI